MKKLSLFLILIFLLVSSGCTNNGSKTASNAVGENIESAYNDYNQSDIGDSVSKDDSIELSGDYNNITSGNEADRMGYTTTEKIMEVSGGTTYGKIIEHLGVPETAGFVDGYAQYFVDDDKFLVLRYQNRDEICLLTGNEILDSCLKIDSFYGDFKNYTTDALVVGVSGSFITVATPNYELFSVATFVLPAENNIKTLKLGDLIRIIHDEKIAAVYPPRIKIVDVFIK